MREDAQEDKTVDAAPRNPLMQTYVDTEPAMQEDTVSGTGNTAGACSETDGGGTGSGMPQVA